MFWPQYDRRTGRRIEDVFLPGDTESEEAIKKQRTKHREITTKIQALMQQADEDDEVLFLYMKDWD